MTKSLGQKSFDYLRKCLGMAENPTVEIKGECWNLIPTATYSSRTENLNTDGKYKGLQEKEYSASDLRENFRT